MLEDFDEGFDSLVVEVENVFFGDDGVGDGDIADGGGDAEHDDGDPMLVTMLVVYWELYICSIVAIGRKSRLGIPGNSRNPYFW